MTATSPLSIGIVGTGGMARIIADLIARTPEARIGAVLSRDPGRAQDLAARHGDGTGTDDRDAFLGAGLDAVYVGSANAAHFDAAEACLAARIPCRVEKPLTTSAAQTRTLCDRAGRDSVLLMENLWTLCLPTHLALKQAVAGGAFGAARHLRFDFSLPVDRVAQPALFDPDAGGVILDRAIYGLGPALDLFGPISDMDAQVTRDGDGVDTSLSLQTRHETGQTAQLWLSFDGFGANTVDLACERGNIRLGPPGIGAEWITTAGVAPPAALGGGGSGGLKARIKALPLARRHLGRAARVDEHRRFLAYGDSPYRPVLTHFLDLVRQGQTESPLVPRALSVAAIAVMDSLRNPGPDAT